MIKIFFLEKFLKSQPNLQTIRIIILTKKAHKREILKRICGILCKIGRLNRVHIDFVKEQRRQVLPGLSKRVRSMKKLPKLRNLEVTVADQQVIPFSIGLRKVGFGDEGGFDVEDPLVIQNLMQKAPKVYHLDTIKIESNSFHVLPDKLWDGLAFVISKLPNFRELDFIFHKELYLPLKQIFSLMDALMKAPKFEILKTGLQIRELSEISFLEHPLLKAKSLKRTHLTLFLREITPEELTIISDLLQEIPSLYELSLICSPYAELNDESVQSFMGKISGMTSIRKLKIEFDSDSENLSEKQAGCIVRWIFNKMTFLEELDLRLPPNCFDLSAYHGLLIQGPSRLKKALIKMTGLEAKRENDLKMVIKTLQHSHQLRELVLDLRDSVYGYQGVMKQLIESLEKWKELQVLRFDASTDSRIRNTRCINWEYFARTFERIRSLQDIILSRSRCIVVGDKERDDEEQDDGQQQNDEEQEE